MAQVGQASTPCWQGLPSDQAQLELDQAQLVGLIRQCVARMLHNQGYLT